MDAVGISVVIPAYGRPEAMLRALHSVQASQCEGVEIIVVDDASVPSLASIVPATNRHDIAVRYYRLARNGGPQAARNLGIRRARFGYIAFLDSDDEFLPEKLDAVRHSLASENCDLLFHAVEGLSGYGQVGRFWNRHLRLMLPFDWLIALLNPVATPSLVIRRNGRLGLPRLRYAEDWAYLMHAAHPAMRVVYLDLPLSRVHRPLGSAGGQSGARWRMRKGEFLGRAMFLRKGTVRGYLQFGLGTGAGCVRVLVDLARLRYWSGRTRRRKQ